MPAILRLIIILLVVAPLLAGCQAAGALVGVEAASVVVFGRGVVDIGVSAATGRDCSIVNLDKGEYYCAPRERLPEAPPFCSKSLGTVNCWSNPEAFVVLPPRELADTPPLTPDQVRAVSARWPKSLNFWD